jgi:hypothetical protein
LWISGQQAFTKSAMILTAEVMLDRAHAHFASIYRFCFTTLMTLVPFSLYEWLNWVVLHVKNTTVHVFFGHTMPLFVQSVSYLLG